MCGRFALTHTAEELARIFRLRLQALDYVLSYNIAPGQETAVVVGGAHEHVPRAMRWGLIPHWADNAGIGSRLINARSETAAEKPSFRTAFRRRRCVVPASGFYEWKKTPDGKVPHYIHARNGSVLPFAGLWDRWEQDRDTVVDSFTILTTEANAVLLPVHDRMPVILEQTGWETWLGTREADAPGLVRLLRPCADDRLEAYPVSRRVNTPANNDPKLILPVRDPSGPETAPGETPSLF